MTQERITNRLIEKEDKSLLYYCENCKEWQKVWSAWDSLENILEITCDKCGYPVREAEHKIIAELVSI